ncbi:hypothetical protein C1646_800864 [Rhizophagus diaphanus]|nr:hypothetical protein C1646_800864 [Rhizophagus diaphanus] [Rhizophagus sp. MUCL 43196]
MSGKKEIIPFIYGVHFQIADDMSEIFFNTVLNTLKTFVTDSFLQVMFSKFGDSALDKATLLTTTFGEDADLKYFLEQSKATNIQPMTLSLIMSLASYTAATGWNEYIKTLHEHKSGALAESGLDLKDLDNFAKDDDTDIITENMPITPTPNPVPISQLELSDIVMTPVDPPVTPEILQKEEINNSTCVPMDKQVINQSRKGNNNNRKKKLLANNLSKPAVIEILTEYEKVPTTKDHSGGKKTDSSNAKSKKKDQQSSSKAPKKSSQLKKPLGQKTKDPEYSDNSKKKAKGGNNSNKEVLAKILELLQKLV